MVKTETEAVLLVYCVTLMCNCSPSVGAPRFRQGSEADLTWAEKCDRSGFSVHKKTKPALITSLKRDGDCNERPNWCHSVFLLDLCDLIIMNFLSCDAELVENIYWDIQ